MRVSLFLLALTSLLVACSDDVDLAQDGSTGGSAGTGGSTVNQGGSAGSATGQGGSAGVAGSAGAGQGGSAGSPACGDLYELGQACTGAERCVDGDTVWHCRNGTEGGFVVADTRVFPGPLPEGCAPQGRWSMTRGAPSSSTVFNCDPSGPDTPLYEDLTLDIDGALLSSLPGIFDASECRLVLAQSQVLSNPSESWTESWQLSLKFSGAFATGSYQRSVTGFCQGSDAGALAVKKLP